MMKYMIGNNRQHNTVRKNARQKGGFTVLYSLLIISLLISISLGIFDIALRDFALAQSAAESQIALFAADAGMECALYYDLKFRGGSLAFATSTVNPQVALSPQFLYACGVPTMPVATPLYYASSDTAVTTLTMYLTTRSGASGPNVADADGPCAIVTVSKSSEGVFTTVDSRGYNICTNSSISTKRVERGLRAAY